MEYGHVKREVDEAEERRKKRVERSELLRLARSIYEDHVVKSERYQVS